MPNVLRVFVDTSVFIYADDAYDTQRRQLVRVWLAHLWATRAGRTSIQVLSEYYVCLTQGKERIQPGLSLGDARAKLRRYQQWQPWVADHATVETAWAIESRYRLSYWDALIVASAQAQGCRFLLTEDLQHEQRIDNVQIVNPFFAGPEWLETSKENL